MVEIVHQEEEMGGVLTFCFPFLLLSQSLQKEGYKYQTIQGTTCREKKILPTPLVPDFCNSLGLRHLQLKTCNIAFPCWGRDTTSCKVERLGVKPCLYNLLAVWLLRICKTPLNLSDYHEPDLARHREWRNREVAGFTLKFFIISWGDRSTHSHNIMWYVLY